MMKSVDSQIEIDDQGVARIAGATTKVIEVVLDKLAYGRSPEEMHFQHPHLSLAQIRRSVLLLRASGTTGGRNWKSSHVAVEKLQPKLLMRP